MALSSQSTSSKAQNDDEIPEVRNDVDRVAQVSRTASGEPHQNPGYEVIGLPEDPTEAQKAAAENRPPRRSRGNEAKTSEKSAEKTSEKSAEKSADDKSAKA